jgi:RNA polymerase sigma-70 factor (ECF subfamily)
MTHRDQHDFEETALPLAPELRRAAERLGGRGRAEDLVQETLLRALAAWTRIRRGDNPRAFLHAILRNTFITEYRRSQRERLLGDDPPPEPFPSTLDRALSLDLRRALGELSPPLRRTLLAVDLEGLAYKEAAADAGTPIGTVMSRLHRARRQVRSRLAA